MIHKALVLLQEEIEENIRTNLGSAPPPPSIIELGNPSLIESGDHPELNDTLLISLVNVEEESTLKNVKVAQRISANGTVRYELPPISLNLYVLICANFPNRYEDALRGLSRVIRFFQGKRVFNTHNTTSQTILNLMADPNEPLRDEIRDMEIFTDLYTMTFEQINHLWGSLGGKQIPFVMYRARLVRIREPRFQREGTLIEEIVQNAHPIEENC